MEEINEIELWKKIENFFVEIFKRRKIHLLKRFCF
jgi:hypothetical protein